MNRLYCNIILRSSHYWRPFICIQQQQQIQQQLQQQLPHQSSATSRRRWLHHDQNTQMSLLSSSSSSISNSNKRRMLSSSSSSRNRRKSSSSDTEKKRNKSWQPSYRFIDCARVQVIGGRGGKGSLSQDATGQHRRRNRLRPDGGNGGNGGSVVLMADPKEQTLLSSWSQRHHAQAQHGQSGNSQNCTGRHGKNTILRVPCGVIVKRFLNDNEVWDEQLQQVINMNLEVEEDDAYAYGDGTDHDYDDDYDNDDYNVHDDSVVTTPRHTDWYHAIIDEEEDNDYYNNNGRKRQQQQQRSVVIADLDTPGSHVVVARGGRGGIGTNRYASDHGPLPDVNIVIKNATPQNGEVAYLELELKLIADIGLVGFPNAGKSSLLHAMSRASPEVAPYPFTTRHPLLGVLEYSDGTRIRVADIPGLIDGAAQGRGCGHDFLRHVERTKALLYIVDAAGSDFRNPVNDLRVLVHELESYGDGTLLEQRAIVVANKVDLMEKEKIQEVLNQLSEVADSLGIQRDHDVMAISAGVTGVGLGPLSQAIRKTVELSEMDRQEAFQITSKAI